MKEELSTDPDVTQSPAHPAPTPGNESASTRNSTAPAAEGRAAAPSAAPRQTVAWWALLVALAAGGVAGWSAWQARDTHGQAAELKETLASRLSDSDTLSGEARALARQQQEIIAQLQGKLGVLEAKIETAAGQAATLENLYQEFSRSRDSRVAAEIHQAVTLAAQQLQLAGNVEAALVALNHADGRLASHDQGQYAPLRRALARDIESLKLLQVLDVPGLGLRLERLLERVERLPLSFETELAAAQTDQAATVVAAADAQSAVASWHDEALAVANRFAEELWHEIRNLVRLERLDQVDPMLLAPAQSTFLRENLKVRLLTARLALLAHDGRSYAADLAQASAMIERFFDAENELVRDTLTELEQLQAVSLQRELPTLTETFAALRMLQANGEPAFDSALAAPALPAGGDEQ